MKFERAEHISGKTSDTTGKIFVRVILLGNERHRTAAKKGNISRVVTIHNAKVSDVFEAIEKALF